MKLNMAYLFCVIMVIPFVTGCSYFTSPLKKPIIEDHSHNKRVTTLATIPSRRMVVMKAKKEEKGKIFICAEPSPDVSDNLVSTFSAALAAEKGTTKASSSIASAIATTAQYLVKRTQGIQLYRDGMYNLCQARMNDIINKEEYKEMSRLLLSNATTLISEEIKKLGAPQPINTPTPVTIKVVAQSSTTGEELKVISETDRTTQPSSPQVEN